MVQRRGAARRHRGASEVEQLIVLCPYHNKWWKFRSCHIKCTLRHMAAWRLLGYLGSGCNVPVDGDAACAQVGGAGRLEDPRLYRVSGAAVMAAPSFEIVPRLCPGSSAGRWRASAPLANMDAICPSLALSAARASPSLSLGRPGGSGQPPVGETGRRGGECRGVPGAARVKHRVRASLPPRACPSSPPFHCLPSFLLFSPISSLLPLSLPPSHVSPHSLLSPPLSCLCPSFVFACMCSRPDALSNTVCTAMRRVFRHRARLARACFGVKVIGVCGATRQSPSRPPKDDLNGTPHLAPPFACARARWYERGTPSVVARPKCQPGPHPHTCFRARHI